MGSSSVLVDLRLRKARADRSDAQSFCGLFNSLYARKVDEEYYRWQFFATPFPSGLAVATAGDGKWIGCYGYHVMPSSDGCSRVAWMLDIMVAAEFQRKGVFGKLAEFAAAAAAEHKPAAMCVMANAKADAAHTGSLGWKRVKEIATFVRGTADVPPSSGKYTCRLVETIDPRALGAIGEQFSTKLASQARSESYFRWRFAENPWYRYSMIMASQGAVDVAALVLKSFRDPQSGESFGDIVDVLWAREGDTAVRDLLPAALNYFRERGVGSAATWLETNSVLDAAGRELGFAEISQRRYFCGLAFDSNERRMESAANWCLTMSAAEIY